VREDCGNFLTENEMSGLKKIFKKEGEISSNREFLYQIEK